jgi:hypothetical protein
MSDKFEQWCIVELFGHNIMAGLVSEQVIGGQAFVRVDVPATDQQPAFTKFYGSGAIYAMTPCDEVTARAAVIGLRQKPIETYKLNIPQLQAPSRSDENDLGDAWREMEAERDRQREEEEFENEDLDF